jgi:hypothetical protein
MAKARHKPKREVEEMLADLNPKEPAKPGIRTHQPLARELFFSPEADDSTLPEKSAHTMTPPAESISPGSSAHTMTPPSESISPGSSTHTMTPPAEFISPESSVPTMTPPTKGGGRARIVPLGNKRYDLKFSFDGTQKAKLERLGELLGVSPHGALLATLVERALDIALKAKDPQLHHPKKPLNPTEAPHLSASRYVPMALKKEVLERADYRCQHFSADALRCRQKSLLQLDHIHPLAWGGTTCSKNLQVLCRSHHRLKTEIQQGPWVHGRK